MFYRKKGSKYNATKIEVDGIVFDSKREAKRYRELSHLLAIGEISDLQLQVPYELIPSVKEPDTFGVKGGRKPGKTIERAVIYKADFQYHDKDGKLVVEDVKGMRTPEYILKRKLMLWRWGIQIKEV